MDKLPPRRHFIRMKRFRALALMIAALGISPGRADDSLVLQLKYTKPVDIVRILKDVAKQSGTEIEITAKDQQITLQGGDEAQRAKLSGLVAEIDVPCGSLPTRFIKLRYASVEKAVDFLNKALASPAVASTGLQRAPASEGSADKDEDIPIQVVPAPRTNEIFVMGHAEDIRLVESLLRAIDTDPPPVFK